MDETSTQKRMVTKKTLKGLNTPGMGIFLECNRHLWEAPQEPNDDRNWQTKRNKGFTLEDIQGLSQISVIIAVLELPHNEPQQPKKSLIYGKLCK